MKTFKLQVFANRCGNCGLEFESLVLPGDYEPILYVSRAGVMRYLDPDEDPVWTETKGLIKAAIKGRRVSESSEAELFHHLLARTIDAPAEGDSFASAWEKPPCPRCGGTTRTYFGPVDPPRFKEVSIAPVTHKRWESLPPAEKAAETERVVQEKLDLHQ